MKNIGNREGGVLRLKKSEKSEVSLHERTAQSQSPRLAVAYSTTPLKTLGTDFSHFVQGRWIRKLL